MTILDTFYTLFESNTDGLKKGLDEAKKESKETAEVIAKTDSAAQKLGESIGRTIRELGLFAAGYLAISNLAQSFNEATHAADKLDETAERLNVNIETLSVWGDAVKEAGGSTEGLIGSIESFNNMLAMMEATGKSRATPFLKELGIDLDSAANKGKTAFELLPKIAAAMEGMERQQSGAIGRKLGLDAGTIMLLQNGTDGLDKLLKKHRELGVITQEQGKVAADWNDQLDDTRHALRTLWLEIATVTLPILTWFAKRIEELITFMRTNKDFIIGFFIAIGSVITAYALPPLMALAAAAIVALAPFALMALAVTAIGAAFALAYDDVMNFLDGNDSLIGRFFEKYPAVLDFIKKVGQFFVTAGGLAKEFGVSLYDAIGETLKIVRELWREFVANWGGDIQKMIDAFLFLPKAVLEGFQAIFDFVDKLLSKFGGVGGVMKSIADGIRSAFKFDSWESFVGPRANEMGRNGSANIPPLGAYGVPGLREGQGQLSDASGSGLAAMPSGAIAAGSTSNKNTNVTIGELNVNTNATDAEGMAKGASAALSSQLAQAASNYDDGVMA